MKLVQYNAYIVSTMDTDGLVLSTRASVATVVSMHPYVSSCEWVKQSTRNINHLIAVFLHISIYWIGSVKAMKTPPVAPFTNMV